MKQNPNIKIEVYEGKRSFIKENHSFIDASINTFDSKDSFNDNPVLYLNN